MSGARPNEPSFLPREAVRPAASSATPTKTKPPGVPPWEITAAHQRDKTNDELANLARHLVVIHQALRNLYLLVACMAALLFLVFVGPIILGMLMLAGIVGLAGASSSNGGESPAAVASQDPADVIRGVRSNSHLERLDVEDGQVVAFVTDRFPDATPEGKNELMAIYSAMAVNVGLPGTIEVRANVDGESRRIGRYEPGVGWRQYRSGEAPRTPP